MQPCCVMAFRARIIKAGYTSVHIKRKKFIDQFLYHVSAVDPLGAIPISRYMSLGDMAVWR